MSLIRPHALRPGDLVGVCAPAGTVEAERLAPGVAEIERLGLRVRVSAGATGRRHFTSGPAASRRDELLAFYADPEVGGIVCARGGAGAGALLPLLDPGLIRESRKPLVGCSDITFLHLFLQRLGLGSVHGPMAAGDLSDGSYDEASLRHALFGEGEPYVSPQGALAPLRDGAGEGVLLGGCLSILAAAAGTPWSLQPPKTGTILFIEDVHERPFRIDRMLRQLRQAGAFSGLRGIVFGEMKGCQAKPDEGYALEAVILDALEGLEVPVAMGLSSGHADRAAVSLPLGVRARLTCGGGGASVEVLEPAVA